jgi:hypothetical protein
LIAISILLHLIGKCSLSSVVYKLLTLERADIFIITYMNTRYRFDTNLNLKQTLNLGQLGKYTEIIYHSFHSNLLVYTANDSSLKWINIQQAALVKEVQVYSDFFTEISITRKFIIAGTEKGVVCL